MMKILGRVSAMMIGAGLGVATAYHLAPCLVLDGTVGFIRRSLGLRRCSVTVDGQRVVLLDNARENATPVVFLHGFAASKDGWLNCVRFLAQTHRIIMPDLPGFGESSKLPEVSYDIWQQVEWLHGLLDALGLAQAHLVGNSMGGFICLGFAKRYPERVAGMTLMNASGVRTPSPSPIEQAIRAGGTPLIAHTPEDYARILEAVFVEPPSMPAPVVRCLTERAVRNSVFDAKVWDDIIRVLPDLTPDLPQIDVPALVLWGDQDRVIDLSAGRLLAERLPRARLVVLMRCGHVPAVERPEQTARQLAEFIRNHPVALDTLST